MLLHIEHHHYNHSDPEVLGRLDQLLNHVRELMADFSKVQADVAAQTSVIQGVTTLLTNLSQQITALKGAGDMDAATQAAIDSLAQSVESNNLALSNAVAANTPVAVPPEQNTKQAQGAGS